MSLATTALAVWRALRTKAVDATPSRLVGGVVGAVERVLDAEVLELVEDVGCAVRQLSQLVQQLLERRAADLPLARVLEHGLRVEQLHLEGVDVGAEPDADRPRLEQAVRDGGQSLAHHPAGRAHGNLHALLTQLHSRDLHPGRQQNQS